VTDLENDHIAATKQTSLRVLRALQRKLEREEVTHLRALANNLQAQLEEAQREAAISGELADFWSDAFYRLQETATGAVVGLTQAGEIVIGQGVPA
jgi:hypothetical protein